MGRTGEETGEIRGQLSATIRSAYAYNSLLFTCCVHRTLGVQIYNTLNVINGPANAYLGRQREGEGGAPNQNSAFLACILHECSGLQSLEQRPQDCSF